MSKSELERLVRVLAERVASLEARLIAVESRPQYFPYQPVPQSPFVVDNGNTWNPLPPKPTTICHSG